MSSTEKYTNCYQIIPKVCLLSTSLEILLASHWLMGNINWSSVHSHSSLYCVGLLRWLRGKESGCQCRRHCRLGLDPWVRKIPWSRKWQPTPVFCWENPIPTHTHTHTVAPNSCLTTPTVSSLPQPASGTSNSLNMVIIFSLFCFTL